MPDLSRRRFITAATATAVTGTAKPAAALTNAAAPPAVPLSGTILSAPALPAPETLRPDDEDGWRAVAAHYDVTDDVINLENGNWGIMARPVLEAYLNHTRMINRDNSYYTRRRYWPAYVAVLDAVAARLGAAREEVALTRGATEALQNIIGGFNRLSPGDAVMYADLDYGSIREAMRATAARAGCGAVALNVPEPATHDGLIAFYRDALDRHPETRLLLLTHVSHRTGLVIPVRAIAREARARGVSTVVDAAHSWGQIDFRVDDLDADFIGFNLHKWMGAPIGVGALYIRRDRLGDISPNLSATDGEKDHIYGRVHSGTSNFAAFLTVPDAFAFHDAVGAAAKAARLRYLRGIWTGLLSGTPGLDILTPEDPRPHAGITSFRLTGVTGVDDNRRLAKRLLDEHGVFTVHRDGVAAGACIRVTPGLYNSADHMRRAAAGIRALVTARS